jgi:hypothetical protein
MDIAKIFPNRYNLGKSVKKIIWIGSSYEDLKEFPSTVRNAIGYEQNDSEKKMSRGH